MCYVLFSNAYTFTVQEFICRYIFTAICSFVPHFREAKFCGVPSRVFAKLGCAAGEESLRNTALKNDLSYTKVMQQI
jgi:hypothetical protein